MFFQLGCYDSREASIPYIIAEIGVNHEGSFEKAIELIDLAKRGGAHAAKFQTYKAHKLAAAHSPSYWDLSKEKTTSQRKLFEKFDGFDAEHYQKLAEHCKQVGIDFVSTPFDVDAVCFLEPLVPFFKIASADLNNLPLLRAVAQTGKPIVMSTGASSIAEIHLAVDELKKNKAGEIILLHCILNYPTDDENAHLKMIVGLRRAFPNLVIGYSDHTMPSHEMHTLTTAYTLGAQVIEKHFTDDKSLPGNDHYHAMDVHDLGRFVNFARKINELIGESEEKHALESEAPAILHARRSIVANKCIKKGEILSEKMLICKRPAHGISSSHWDTIIGMVATRDINEDTILQWQDVAEA